MFESIARLQQAGADNGFVYYWALENYYRDHSDEQMLALFDSCGILAEYSPHRACSVMNECSRRGVVSFTVDYGVFEAHHG